MFSSELENFWKKCGIVLAIIATIIVIFLLKEPIGIIISSLFLTTLLHPVLVKLENKRIPTAVSILGLFLIIGIIILIGIGSAIPLIIEGISTLLEQARNIPFSKIMALLPESIQTALPNIDANSILSLLAEQKDAIISASKKLLSGGSGLISGVVSGITSFGLIIVFSFFFSLERKEIGNFFLSFLPKELKKTIEKRQDSIFASFLNWMRGQVLLCGSIFLMTFVGLGILSLFGVGVPHIFALSLVAGIAECIPYVWPFIALLPALSLALPEWIPVIIAILILYIGIQQTENNILVPFLVGKTLNLSPSYVLIATLFGFTLFGIIGVLVALPMAAAIQILFFSKK